MGRIRRTIELARASWAVLKADKELMVLPVISAFASLIIAATFVVPFWGTLDSVDTTRPGAVFYVLMFLMYVVLAFVTSSSTPPSSMPPTNACGAATRP